MNYYNKIKEELINNEVYKKVKVYSKNKSDLKLSFSSFTFPHQLVRLILAEQIYRVFKINNNEEYHK